MKIAFVLDDSLDRTDGVQQYVLSLGRWLTDRGHIVHYLVGETKRLDVKHVHSLAKNWRVSFNGNRLSIPLPTRANRLRKLLEAERFDIMHVQAPYSPFLAGKIMRLAPLQTAVVATFHIIPYGKVQQAGARLLSLANRRSAQRIQTAVSVSAAARNFVSSVFGLETDILPNVIDYERFQKAKVPHHGPVKNVVFLGRHVQRKGCMELIEAIYQLSDSSDIKDLHVHIGGTGPLTRQLQRYVKQHRLESHVTFDGFVPEDKKSSFLAQADIAVFPSLGGESFGIVLAEAMAAGAGVVIGGDNIGYRCVLGEWAECLINPSDPKTFARQLSLIIQDEDLRKRIHNEQQQAVKKYAVERVGAELEQLYKSAIAKTAANKDN